MTRLAIRSSLAALTVTGLAAALAAAPGAMAAAPAGPQARLVLSVAPGFQTSELPPGVTVLSNLAAVHAVVVRAPVGAQAWLGGVPGVRGVSADRRLHVTSSSSPIGGGTYAPAWLGNGAGGGTAGSGVTVAIVDTGVADTAALNRASGRLVSGPNYSGSTDSARDGYGHGTFMADLIAGGSMPNTDVIGIAPAAKVIDVKVAGSDGSTTLSDVLNAFNWVANNASANGIKVLSLSMSATRPQTDYGPDPLTNGAEAVRSAGVVFDVASGNDPSQVGDPGQDPYLMTVGAADTTGSNPVVASFSGSAVVDKLQRPDIVTPGVSILSVLPPNSLIATQHPAASAGNGLYRGSGTSQATAITAGAVALFLSRHPGLSPDDVRVSFAKSALPIAGTGAGAGLISIPGKVFYASDNANSGAGTGTNTAGDPAATSTSWSASSWSASSWSATSWSSTSWSSTSWSSTSWSSTSWSASSWSASSWSSAGW